MPINPNANEYRSVVGLDSLYVAEVTADSAAAYTADTPEYLAPAAEASHKPSVSSEPQYADNQTFDVMSAEGETVIELSLTGVPNEMLAKISGETFDAASGRVFDSGNAEPPYFALMFRADKSGGGKRYYSYLKGRFEKPAEEAATKADKVSPKMTKLIYHAIGTKYQFGLSKSFKRVFGDTDTTSFSATGWFSQVQTPVVVAPSALALSSADPADGASGVATSETPVLTFNNALINNAIYMVTLAKADGTVAAVTAALDATKKIMTITPGSALSASTTYLLSYAVEDIYGQHLSGVVNFATA